MVPFINIENGLTIPVGLCTLVPDWLKSETFANMQTQHKFIRINTFTTCDVFNCHWMAVIVRFSIIIKLF